ncbi:hypothetical protein PAASB05_05710 [Pantoea agglomerans]|uniref:hypothetical protein n=1 Tax=Enterobacter agglomerans TaxID=549 RepID=UPI0013023D25|nr:hypothetical protein [Pantoea agglomerans]QGY57407.1 hypothetical protein PAASB05_05710 [Pantoea agglomerans]
MTMRERPILFNADMVSAVLDGRKTQTRRLLTPHHLKMIDAAASAGECYPLESGRQHANSQSYYREWCPFGAVGDRLWVRETFRVHSRATDVATLVYKASEQQSWTQQTHRVPIEKCNKPAVVDTWTPSIHMPRWASRITLEITGVRVERLQSISEEDAKAEGVKTECSVIGDKHFLGFRSLWKSIYGDDSWQANPWVWVVEFKRVEGQ